MKRVLAVAAVAVLAAVAAPGAGATRECDGLDVCISVPGPWVAVPAAPASGAQSVEYELGCPRGSIVGGLDAVLGVPSLRVLFLGELGSPVNPGITTSDRVVFVVTHASRARTFFRPLIGCIPTSGGGRGTTGVAARAPGPALVRRVRSFRVRPGAQQTFVVRCAAGERLVGSSHAVAFRTQAAPSVGMLGAVSVARRELADRVVIRARRGVAVPARSRVEVQLHALCFREQP